MYYTESGISAALYYFNWIFSVPVYKLLCNMLLCFQVYVHIFFFHLSSQIFIIKEYVLSLDIFPQSLLPAT